MRPLELHSEVPAPGSAFHETVSGLLVREDRLLLVRRGPAKAWAPGRFDLPGGHREPGETEPAALERELREELAVEVGGGDALLLARLRGPNFDAAYYLVASFQGEPRNAAPEEHTGLAWFLEAELAGLAGLELAGPEIRLLAREVLGRGPGR